MVGYLLELLNHGFVIVYFIRVNSISGLETNST